MRARQSTTQNPAPGIRITSPWRISKVMALPRFRLEVTFIDGLHGYVDLSAKVLSNKAGVFSKLKDPSFFEQVYVEYGVVTWPGELDLAPDAMHAEIKKNGCWVLK